MIALSLVPLLLAAATLLCEWLGPCSFGRWLRVAALLCLVALPVVLALAARRRGSSAVASHLLAAPALLAPLSVCFPWTVVPDHLGLAFVQFGFFLHWLTKYPNWGAINHEVLLGILCVLGCAFLPWLSATLLLARRSPRITRAILLGLVLIPYLPVLIRLDLALLFSSADAFAHSLTAQPSWVFFGPLLRLAAILSMIGMLFEERLGPGGPD